MVYVTPEQIAKAKEVDLLTYLQNYEPEELVRVSANTYSTRTHDSLSISNGKWHWFSQGIGGRTALDYLIKVRGYTFTQAVETISGRTATMPPVFYAPQKTRPQALLMPELNGNTNMVVRYLQRRGIHPEIINHCLTHKLLLETQRYHNAVFVGYDTEKKMRYAALRGTIGNFKGEVTGSDKHYSFKIMAAAPSGNLHLFESAIDLLSYATLSLMAGKNWRQNNLLSLAGVYKMQRESVVPIALSSYLDNHPQTKAVYLHLDNDEVGRRAAAGIMAGLKERYTVIDEPPSSGKDMNELLQRRLGRYARKEDWTR